MSIIHFGCINDLLLDLDFRNYSQSTNQIRYVIFNCNYNYSHCNCNCLMFTEPGRYEIFNGTGTDYFKILDVDEASILIGSK